MTRLFAAASKISDLVLGLYAVERRALIYVKRGR
jgi:hypothetical protein